MKEYNLRNSVSKCLLFDQSFHYLLAKFDRKFRQLVIKTKNFSEEKVNFMSEVRTFRINL